MVFLEVLNGKRECAFETHTSQPVFFHKIPATTQNIQMRHPMRPVVVCDIGFASGGNLHQADDERRDKTVDGRKLNHQITALA